jgi:thiamine pyrophosphokinase
LLSLSTLFRSRPIPSPAHPTYALIFANGDVNDGEMVRRALAEAGPDALLIAADGGARVARYLGFTVHAVIGDMDSITALDLQRLERAGAVVLRSPAEKDETDLELTLLYAAEQGVAHIRVLGAMGDRLDQTISNLYLLALPPLAGRDARVVAGRQEAFLLPAGGGEIEGAPGDTVSLLPLNGTAHGVTTDGLYYPLNDEDLVFGPARGVSNIMTGDRARVTTDGGVLLVLHTLGRA